MLPANLSKRGDISSPLPADYKLRHILNILINPAVHLVLCTVTSSTVKAAKRTPELFIYRTSLAMILQELGALYAAAGIHVLALTTGQEGVDVYRELARVDPARYKAVLADALVNLGTLYRDANRIDDARQSWQEALAL
jgi:tetratricopeptide (TPR) repeat protein